MLEVRDLHSFYGDAHILRGVSIDVAQGKVVALLGRNGMGKTTLIRSVMGLMPPRVTRGSVSYCGVSLLGLPPHGIAKHRIAIVPQGRRLFASLTVVEHLTMLGRKEAGQWTVERLLKLFPRLAERAGHRGSQLSGGERQMLAICRALVTDPELLLMDEPSEGLAPVMVQHLEGIITQLKQAGLAILLVEQNLFSALTVADDVYILETGQIVYHDVPDRLREDRASMIRFLGVS